MQDEPFYFKFLADEAMERKNRTDKVVFYTNEEQLNTVIKTLISLKQERPDLLIGSEKTNPFMKKIDGFIRICTESYSAI